MRANAGILILIGLLLLVGMVAADLQLPTIIITPTSGGPLGTTVTSSKEWVVANGVDTSQITVHVVNTSSTNPQPNATVTFTLTNPVTGSLLAPTTTVTDAAGNARCTFKVNTSNGVARIQVDVSYLDLSGSTYTAVNYIDQKIDHDSPYVVNFDYPLEATVATDVPFIAIYTDRWGNKIDDRKSGDIHTVTMHISGPAPYDNGFVIGSIPVKDTTVTIDTNGNASVTVRLTSTAGPNNIQMDAFGSLSDKYRWITETSTGGAVTISEFIDPPGADGPILSPIPYVKADGTETFTLKYTLYDKYNNPAGDQWIWINTTIPGEERRYKSNSLGQVWITYGPRETKSTITVTAIVEANDTVSISQDLDFYNTDPVNMEITANPETMPSNDVDPSLRSKIRAKIVDEKGNPVAGQAVTFSIGTAQYDGNYTITSAPALMATSDATDGDGFAEVDFKPGAFTTDVWDPKYSELASGNCTVTATWNVSSKSIKVTWKNYPYLSVSTKVEPVTVALHDIVTVSIILKGDGYKMQPNPIDAMLVIDKSGSMAWDVNNNPSGTPSKLTIVKAAASTFVDNMSPVRDRVGLQSYQAHATTPIDHVLSTNFVGVKSRINGMNATGNTATRNGLKNATDYFIASMNPDPDAVHAIILLSDGAYNTYGDPLARGTGYNYVGNWGDGSTSWYRFPDLSAANQNLATYASSHGIRIYTIAFGDLGTATEDTMELLATNTGGKYYHVYTAGEVAQTYSDIAGELRTAAGVNTQMDVNFDQVNVTGVKMPGKDVYEYVYDPAGIQGSTSWRSSGREMYFGDNETTVILPALDQRDDWDNTTALPFDIGTVVLNETYTVTFKLKVNQTGSIDIFAPGSLITFNNGEETLNLPHTYLTVSSTLINTGSAEKTIQLTPITTGKANVFIPLEWQTFYDGRFTVGEEVAYRVDNSGPWLVFTEIHGISPGTHTQNAQLDMRKLPPGGYSFRVKAYVEGNDRDAAEAYAYSVASTTYGGMNRSFIRLE